MNADRFNQHIAAGRQAAEGNLAALERGYRITLQSAARHAADRFAALATDHLTADVTDPKWTPPENDQLIDPARMAADAQKRTQPARHAALKAVVAPALADIGISYTVTNPLVAGLIDTLGVRAQDMGDAIRNDVAAAVLDGYQTGMSVADTAKQIQQAIEDVAPARAAMLARTDLVAVANGASVAAVRLINNNADGGPQIGYKQWQATADERTRETHAEADGQTVPIDQPFQVGGEQADYPGDPGLSDEEACNCRCSITYMEAAGALTAIAADGGPDVSNLAMVAVYPRAHEATSLAVDGGLDPGDLHCTLLFLGDAESIDLQALTDAVAATARSLPPIDGEVGGAAHFAEGPDGYPSIVLPDVQGLSTLQETVRANLSDAGIVSPSEHGFTPHMTLRYTEGPQVPDPANLGSPLHFDALSIVVAKNRTDYPLTGTLAASMQSPTGDVPSAGHMDESPSVTFVTDALEERIAELLTAAVTVTVDDEASEAAAELAPTPTRWRAILCIEGQETQDNPTLARVIREGTTTWRELPLPLGVMYQTPHSDDVEAEVCGLIDTIYRDQADFRIIWGEGLFNMDEVGVRAAARVGDLSLRGVSIDPYVPEIEITEVSPDTPEAPGKTLVTMINAVICAATICPVQALDGAQISLLASADGTEVMPLRSDTCFVLTREIIRDGVASAGVDSAQLEAKIDHLAGLLEEDRGRRRAVMSAMAL